MRFAGVNLAGAEFGRGMPGAFGRDYIYPNQGEVDYFKGKGMNLVRLPFRWERLQRALYAELDPDELARLDGLVRETTAKGVCVLLDPHNFARYGRDVVGTEALPNAAFADFWARLAALYAGNPRVFFGLMNEPHGMLTEQWVAAANAAIAAIRKTGATNPIFVPGNAFSGAHCWDADWYGTPNAVAMREIADPADNFVIEAHQYLDRDNSGRSDVAVSPTIGSERLQGFTRWLRENGMKGFLGEFACGSNETGMAAMDDMLSFMDANADVWIGWCYWAAGPWWSDSPTILEPVEGRDRPQMAVLARHLPRDEASQAGQP